MPGFEDTPSSAAYKDDYYIYQSYDGLIQTAGVEYPLNSDSASSCKSSLNENYQNSSWCADNGASISDCEIKDIFSELQSVFGFQKDNTSNMYEFLMVLLDSRSSRMSCKMALQSLHADYIGGDRSNFKKWYFAVHIHADPNIIVTKSSSNKESLDTNYINENEGSLMELDNKWRKRMNELTDIDYIYQIALYLLIWGEANNVRFMPECICFIYQCGLDYLMHIRSSHQLIVTEELKFLDNIITPLYNYIRDQQYVLVNNSWKKNTKDHKEIIGYDDVNQFFWSSKELSKLRLSNGIKLYELPKTERYSNLKNISWRNVFFKTYLERRTWIHTLTNFSRIWIIHVTMFWYYTSYNSPTLYTIGYNQLLDQSPAPQVQISVVALGGALSGILTFAAIFAEILFIPRRFPIPTHWFWRLLCTLLTILINTAPSVYIFLFLPLDSYSIHGTIIAIVQFVISIITFLYLAIREPAKLFLVQNKKDLKKSSVHAFVSLFPNLRFRSKMFSYILWISVFAAKFSESYFFLTLSVRDPIRVLSIMRLDRCIGDVIFGTLICSQQANITLSLLFLTDFILFFLDTYLWYIVCNCLFSVGLSFSLGISIFTPWRNIFSRLPERISSKIIFSTCDSNKAYIPVAQIWNSIIVSMFREHLLSSEQVNKLVFQNFVSSGSKNSTMKPPLFFVFQDDNSFHMGDFFNPGKEAERRISFFAQSLSTPLPDTYPILAMPSFSVLVPHYAEKIILQLKEIIKEDSNSRISLLNYLQQLYPNDWECFVKDSKVLDYLSSSDYDFGNISPSHFNLDNNSAKSVNSEHYFNNKINDLPYYCVGFKSSNPENTLRTRLWTSLRYQTLYRTISGFSNYETALRLLYCAENTKESTTDISEEELKTFVSRKFTLLISMQRLQDFSQSEYEDVFTLLKSYPNTNIAYLEEEIIEDGPINYYSTLIDSERSRLTSKICNKYRIKLSGNPILGDGKSDNQNNSIPFIRGEYIQVIDANQDNYLEECLKIKAVLAEFEEMNLDSSLEYISQSNIETSSIAILGAREYIFSENIGVLGDIAAGKEQTFGTLFARTLAEIGGKLHYGHPDFINTIFMTTRGGVSKAQKGLHLNEDIYAGMTAVCRGGRIKHCDFYQCGKGRDLGFGTILNFTTKIGSGMGEQLLSREYYFLGSFLPLDMFLSFYYAHPGFHINNVFIILSLQLFMLLLMNLGSLVNETILCDYNPLLPVTDVEIPIGCYNLKPVLNWISRFVLSIFICFFISFMPLIIQELLEKGIFLSAYRIFYHFISMAPFFEVFVCQVYAKSLSDNIMYGGARYIATGRGFATSRIPFSILYSRYAGISIYKGIKVCMIIVFSCITMWQLSLLWFWVTVISMSLAPFIFNPHQFVWSDFFLDYRQYIKWLSSGNSRIQKSSWVEYVKQQRSRIKGTKGEKRVQSTRGVSVLNLICGDAFVMLIESVLLMSSFLFINSQNGVRNWSKVNPLLRIIVISLFPYATNILILVCCFLISILFMPIFSCCCTKGPAILAGTAHFLSLLFNLISIEVLLYVEGWNFRRTCCGIIFIMTFHDLLNSIIVTLSQGKELSDSTSNLAWWSGKWFGRGLGSKAITGPFTEFFVKVVELNLFVKDFLIGHILFFTLLPIVYIPFIDKWHSTMLFWLKISKRLNYRIFSKRQKRKRAWKTFKYYILLHLLLLTFLFLLIAPHFIQSKIPNLSECLPCIPQGLFQPNYQNNNDTGPNAPWFIPSAIPPPYTIRTVP
ncbi:uncharacterized protein RJT21DRAFT_102848 [Scheffersomyces amazonensis]|uniref:uncharacterized protein n=1 Tax=Scheffersomyces amazonensis TaxID=1078765 RepID=UPI00315D93EC